MRVIFDTNVYVSMAIRSTKLKPLRDAWETGLFTTLITTYLLAEVEDVLRRPKLAPYLDVEDVTAFMEQVKTLGEAVIVKQPHPEFRDPKDRYLLAMLRDGEADVLVTGDVLLLELESFLNKPILNPAQFIVYLEKDKES
jgi:putative PIN family toxin of toxin-antitoxin system